MKETNPGMLGVIGGLGPIATAYFMELVIKMTRAECDQQHLDMIIYNIPSTPDRTAFLLGKSQDSPLPKMLSAGRGLRREGAAYIALPCVTAHNFLPELEARLGVPVIDGVRETAVYLKERGICRAGILATEGTISSRLFHRELAEQGIEPIAPEEEGQKAVTGLIYSCVKAGKTPDMQAFFGVSQQLRRRGAQVIILGCTELSLIKRDYAIGPGCLDVLEVLAQRSITLCQKELKPEYRELITV